ncbi:hypothetical protein OCK74_04970 [Chitinophagaceae bacterium LB-8]|uniref:Uncharacterized protein n=1 Tax=Paraflavisolibacter caeni TaxID=2982496 RepID=A0A9X3BF91_9BACT|nr:hypothetical protein [Paraflavisolibacter caeni]MCU7548454.1 hypothetical protein [Paraflavisolibacter caeni]
MKNKTIYTSAQTEKIKPLKIELVYTDSKEIAAVQVFTKGGMFSYNSSGMELVPAGENADWDASWFENYE